MSGRIGTHIRSNVVGYVALFIALGGVTYAAGLAKDSVKAKQIKTGAVRSDEAKDNSLTGDDVADGGLAGADVADGGLTGADVANDSFTGIDVANDSLTGDDVAEGTLVLPGESATALLDKLKTVDGAGSGLSADSLDSVDSSDLYTKADSDNRFPLADANFAMVAASSVSTYVPFANWAELNLACDAGGAPSLSLTNKSGSNLRLYTDTGDPAPAGGPPLANNTTGGSVTGAAPADGNADHVTYLTRGPLGTVRFEAWYENLNASTNCLFNVQAFGQAIGLTPVS